MKNAYNTVFPKIIRNKLITFAYERNNNIDSFIPSKIEIIYVVFDIK